MSESAAAYPRIRGAFHQFLVLTRHFYLRLFHNDLVAFGDQMREKVIAVLAFLAILCGHISNVLMFRYALQEDRGTSWVEKCFVITFFMLLMGLVSVFEWDVIFPDHRDFQNLNPLPITTRTLFLSKFASLLMFVSFFALALNAVSVFVFAFHLVKWQSRSLLFGLRFMGVHVLATFTAVFFCFFFNVFLIGLLVNLLGSRLFARLSVWIRTLFLVTYVFFLAMYLSGNVFMTPSFDSFLGLKARHDLFLYLFPPMWFTGLYEYLVGNQDPYFLPHVYLAVLSLLGALGLFYVTMGLGYRRSLRHMASGKASRFRFHKLRSRWESIFHRLVLPNPIQKAVYVFSSKTLKQSHFHKVRLASFMAVGLGLILVLLLPQPEILREDSLTSRTLMAVPLILGFFLLIGLRGIVQIPSSLEANWVFRLTEDRCKRLYFSALRKVIVFRALIPLFFFCCIFYTFLWGLRPALLHSLFGLVTSAVLMEVLFLKQKKIPFACSYLPGQERLQLFWMPYTIAFLVYIVTLTKLEVLLLNNPGYFVVYYAVVVCVLIGIRLYQRQVFYKKLRIVYEEKPAAVLLGLQPVE
jgi:hypothetical protein